MKNARRHLLVVCLLFTACQSVLPTVRTRLDDEGGLYLYLDPLRPEAERLRLRVAAIAAVRDDGREEPLGVALSDVKAADARRQRLLATGPLPAGSYGGFVFRMAGASLQGEDRESDLLVPEAATRIDFRFTVRRGESSVVALALRYAEAVEAGFRFTPAFTVYAPERPAAGVMGFVANSRSNDVTVFDKKAMRVFDVVATGRKPSSLALDPRARRLYVALAGDDAVDVVDILAGHIADRIRLAAGDEPAGLALTPDGRILLCANSGSNTVSFIDVEARFEVARVEVGGGPRSILIDRPGQRAFVFSQLSNTVTVLDIPTRTAFRSIPTDPGALRGQLNRRGDRLYVIHETRSSVTVINPVTLTVTSRFPVRAPMEAIKVDPNTDFVYLAGRRDPVVGVHDPFSFAPVDFIDAGVPIAYITTDGDENALYLVSADADRVFVSDRVRKRITGALDVGDGPTSIAVVGEN